MSSKRGILSALDRNRLRSIVDGFGIDGVDRRSTEKMRTKLSSLRRVKPDGLLAPLSKTELQGVCDSLSVSRTGKKQDLIDRILSGNGKPIRKRESMTDITTTDEKKTGLTKQAKPHEKLTLAKLERKLFEACDILRGNMDAAEYKEYIFGMLFLKRLSDQFDVDQIRIREEAVKKGIKPQHIEKSLQNPDKYDFFIPAKAHWSKLRHLKESVGSGLNKALAAIEDGNPNTLQDVLKAINFNRKVGQRTMDDSTLIEFIQHFDEIPLSNDDFEFPDLLGAAYEYLIKYFADSAGKKGGEFYTPAEVVRMMVHVLEPQEGMSVCDPCAGSGGMLIQSRHYVEEIGGNPRDLSLAGQELNGGTWAVCKMNMILHGIRSADIRQGCTLKNPQHRDKATGEIRRFDRVIANPPFAQNAPKKADVEFPERYHTFTKGKKADLMFVQHMASSLKSDGKLAVVMPHGVLFRSGEEKECRKRFIKEGILEAVIGLPAGLFYGTGIPACVLVINKDGASKRKSVLFINADLEFKESKNQNSLRPEDIEKITHVYHKHLDVSKYSRNVPIKELEDEDFNLNIRRYVDNSPPPEPHDVRAHLHGGVPLSEVDALGPYFDNYAGLRELLFQPRDENYLDFAEAIQGKDDIKLLIESADGVQQKHKQFHQALDKWWKKHVNEIEALPDNKNVFDLRRQFLGSLGKALVPQGILDLHQVHGALAAYMNSLAADFKSVAASGWGPELIPEEDILQSQFPEVLEKIEQDHARIAELEALFATADANEEGEEPEESEDGVLPKELVKSLKADKKELTAKVKQIKKHVKSMRQDAKRMEAADYSESEINEKLAEASDDEAGGIEVQTQIEKIDEQLARHSALEAELKTLKSGIKEVGKQRDELVTAARSKISVDEAKQLILERFQRVLSERFDGYLRQIQRDLIADVENLCDKYAVTTKEILSERNKESAQLNRFLKELGYE